MKPYRWMMFNGLLMLALTSAAGEQKQHNLVEKLHEAYQDIQFFQSDFTQTKSVKFLSQPIVSTGQMVYSTELGLIWEVKKPVWVKTIINDQGVFKSNARHGSKKVKDPQIKVVASILTELLSSKLDRVESQFQVMDVVQNVQSGHWSVTLQAKGVLIKKAISSITIKGIDNSHHGTEVSVAGTAEKLEKNTGIQHLVVVDAQGNETHISLSNQFISQLTLTDELRQLFQ